MLIRGTIQCRGNRPRITARFWLPFFLVWSPPPQWFNLSPKVALEKQHGWSYRVVYAVVRTISSCCEVALDWFDWHSEFVICISIYCRVCSLMKSMCHFFCVAKLENVNGIKESKVKGVTMVCFAVASLCERAKGRTGAFRCTLGFTPICSVWIRCDKPVPKVGPKKSSKTYFGHRFLWCLSSSSSHGFWHSPVLRTRVF